MKINIKIFYLVIIFNLFFVFCSNEEKSRDAIFSYLPSSNEVAGWSPDGKPDFVIGDALFELINGGAEIYHEYGFKKAIAQYYKNKNGQSLNLEIFEMDSPASAYGIYTFKTGKSGKHIQIGHDALLVKSNLNFWKGNILVSITGFDQDAEIMHGIVSIARWINSKIKASGAKPELINLLPTKNLKENSIHYLRGNLSLQHFYQFDTKDIFGLKEGVIGDYGEYTLFIFKYKDELESEKWYANARSHIKDNDSFSDFLSRANWFSLNDKIGKPVVCELYSNYILIVIGVEKKASDLLVGRIQDERIACSIG